MPKLARLNDIEIDQFLLDAVTINELEIDREIMECASQLAYFTHRHADASRAYLVAKVDVKRVRSRKQIELRTEAERKARLAAAGGEKSVKVPTEAHTEALVDCDTEVQEAENDLIDAEVEVKKLSGCLDAIRIKCDMVRSIAARLRAEMERS